MGDQLKYKIRVVLGTTRTIPSGSDFVGVAWQFNSLAALVTNIGSSGGMATLSSWFERYKMYGIKLKITYWPLAPNSQPICGFINGSANSTLPVVSVAETPEQRWAKYKVLSFPGQGTRPTTLTHYLSAKKVWGDHTSFISSNLEATVNVVAPHFNTPVVGPYIQYGLFTLNDQNAAADILCDMKIEATAYCRFWGRREQNL